MELGRIFVCTNLEFAADTNESTKRCPGGDLDGSFIVSLRNEGFDVLHMSTACHFGFTEKLRKSRTPGAMLRRPFRYRRSFMYSTVSDMSYIAESGASWEVESGSVAKLWVSKSGLGIAQFDSTYLKRAQQQMCVCMSLLTAMRLSIIRSFIYSLSDRV